MSTQQLCPSFYPFCASSVRQNAQFCTCVSQTWISLESCTLSLSVSVSLLICSFLRVGFLSFHNACASSLLSIAVSCVFLHLRVAVIQLWFMPELLTKSLFFVGLLALLIPSFYASLSASRAHVDYSLPVGCFWSSVIGLPDSDDSCSIYHSNIWILIMLMLCKSVEQLSSEAIDVIIVDNLLCLWCSVLLTNSTVFVRVFWCWLNISVCP